jgi:hypothetical protein
MKAGLLERASLPQRVVEYTDRVKTERRLPRQ